jgi:hypothetical protein
MNPMHDCNGAAGLQGAVRLAKKAFRIVRMKNVKQHGVSYRPIRQPRAFGYDIAL